MVEVASIRVNFALAVEARRSLQLDDIYYG